MQTMMSKPRALRWAMAVFLTLGLRGAAQAVTEVKYNDFLQSVTIKGDMRVRHESFFNENGAGTTPEDRHRERFRLRIGVDFALPADLSLKTRFATGGADQVSQNQSFDDLGSKKEFRIDQAFVHWKTNDNLSLSVGKMANPVWRVYSSDIVWDDDFNPEGFAQQLKFRLPGIGTARGFANVMQMVADEDYPNGSRDQWMFAQQLGVEALVLDQSRITVAGTLYEWVYESSTTANGDFSQGTANHGNRRSAGNALSNQFRVWELTGEYATSVVGVPLSFQGSYIVNVKSRLSPREDTGVQAGVIVGKANEAKTWEAAYFFKQVRTDATVADVADSDFGPSGGTNRRGHIVWIGYSPTLYLNFRAKCFFTKPLNRAVGTNASNIETNRLQLDMSVKF